MRRKSVPRSVPKSVRRFKMRERRRKLRTRHHCLRWAPSVDAKEMFKANAVNVGTWRGLIVGCRPKVGGCIILRFVGFD